MKVAIAHNSDPQTLEVVGELKKLLLSDEIVYDEKYPDIVITVGGDGTLIHAFHRYIHQIDSIRFVGIHTGHLGFYTDWHLNDLAKMVQALKMRKAETTSYPLLDVTMITESGDKKHYLALNESSVKRVSHTLEANVLINDQLFENFRGDGLCISTPTGSTAYSKSLGGAVIDPHLKALQMTEIASINNRVFRTLSSPIVLAPTQWITIIPNTDHFVMTLDGDRINVRNAKKIIYKISKQSINFDRFGHHLFWPRVKNAFINENDEDVF